MKTNTAKSFVLQLGSLATMYASLAAIIVLFFGVITVVIPDAVDGYWQYESATSSIRFSIATLLVFFPAYLVLTRLVNVERRRGGGEYLGLTKWLIYLSLFIGGAILLGDAVALILGFLNGELTLRFFLKAAVLAAVVKVAFFYYIMDARGYWQKHERESIYMGVLMFAIVVAALVTGFSYSETPAQVREMRIDDNQISELQNVQYSIDEYYRINEKLPSDLALISQGIKLPDSPDGRGEYIYEVTGDMTYKLCAEFKQDSSHRYQDSYYPVTEANYNWNHKAGNWCFERKVSKI